MKCPHCGNLYKAHKHGKTDNGKQRYKCSNWSRCGKTFTEVNKKVFIINCPKCGKETEGVRFGRVWYFDKKELRTGIRKHRYKCSECPTVTVKLVQEEERG